MAVVTLAGCAHRFVKNWSRDEDGWTHMTCLACYQRLKQYSHDDPRINDIPVVPGRCKHGPKDAISGERQNDPRWQKSPGTYDVICKDCGCILRHPDGKGAWEEVIWNGFLILEMP